MRRMRRFAPGKRSKSSAATPSMATAPAAERAPAAMARPRCPDRCCGCRTMRCRSAPAVRRNSGWDVESIIAGALRLWRRIWIHGADNVYGCFFFSVLFGVRHDVSCLVLRVGWVVAVMQILWPDLLCGLFGVLGSVARRKTVPAGAAVWPVLPQCDDQYAGQ